MSTDDVTPGCVAASGCKPSSTNRHGPEVRSTTAALAAVAELKGLYTAQHGGLGTVLLHLIAADERARY